MEFDVSKYLEKFQTLLPRETRVRNAIIEAVQEVLGIALKRHVITVSGSQVFVQGSASLKSELALKQAKIIAYVTAKYPDLLITNLR